MGQPQAWLDQASALWSGFLCPGSACRHPSPFGEQISWTLSSCHPVSSGTLGSRELLFLSMLIQTLGCALYTETEQNALGNYSYQASDPCPEPITVAGVGEQMPSLGGAVTLSGGGVLHGEVGAAISRRGARAAGPASADTSSLCPSQLGERRPRRPRLWRTFQRGN